MKLAGSVALVTGANRGLGAAFVEGLVARGAKVYACAREVANLAPLIQRAPDRIIPLQLDVTDRQSIDAAAVRASDTTLLVNNAGRLDQLSLGEAGDLSSLRGEIEVNVFGMAAMCLAVAPVIGRNGGGAIVNMLSRAAIVPPPHFGTYAASKAAAMSLTHSMRWDFEPLGIRLIGVYAGLIATEMVSNINMPKVSPEAVVGRVLDGIEAGENDIAVDEPSTLLRAQFHAGLEEALQAARDRSTYIRANFPTTRPRKERT
jgi:NAD(P)-dependent dehydrogenase (short-subunit alcohol dehydrogenase family)